MEWQTFAHEADIGVRGFGATPERAFEQPLCLFARERRGARYVDAIEEHAVMLAHAARR